MKLSERKIAITGGIGSGKSTVGEIIRGYGYPVYSCDAVYADLLKDRHFIASLAKEFGFGIVCPDGSLDRNELSRIVFSDKVKLERLNEITHPAIMSEMFSRAEGKGTSFFEVPLLFESGFEKLFDDVIVVLRDREKRISEVIRRDGLTREQVCRRISNQYNYDIADFGGCRVIHNDGTRELLAKNVKDLLAEMEI